MRWRRVRDGGRRCRHALSARTPSHTLSRGPPRCNRHRSYRVRRGDPRRRFLGRRGPIGEQGCRRATDGAPSSPASSRSRRSLEPLLHATARRLDGHAACTAIARGGSLVVAQDERLRNGPSARRPRAAVGAFSPHDVDVAGARRGAPRRFAPQCCRRGADDGPPDDRRASRGPIPSPPRAAAHSVSETTSSTRSSRPSAPRASARTKPSWASTSSRGRGRASRGFPLGSPPAPIPVTAENVRYRSRAPCERRTGLESAT
jgi:hypothetical protein